MIVLTLLITLVIYSEVDAQELNAFEQECLDAHNFYRSTHNVPSLKWDPKLQVTSQRWADEIMRRSPDNVKPTGDDLTEWWPHSDQDGYYREQYNIGENIAWDLSPEGHSAAYYVLKFYEEIFKFNPDKPHAHGVGHYTTMLDRDATHVGCAVAQKKIDGGGGWWPMSTRVVVQYRNDPNGDDYSVPEVVGGTCMTKEGQCGNNEFMEENQCLAFGPTGQCSCSTGQASCAGENGCIVQCPYDYMKPISCRGKTKCECTADNNAVCD